MRRYSHFMIAIALPCALALGPRLFVTAAAGKDDSAQRPTNPAPTTVCGNGLIERGEDCKSCAIDCTPLSCAPGKPTYLVSISLATHPAWEATAATIHLSYRTDRLAIPGNGSSEAVRRRVDFGSSDPGITAFNDLDHSIRIVRAEAKPLPRPLVTIELDSCAGAPEPAIGDLSCVVEGCAGLGGAIEDGCACELSISKRERADPTADAAAD